jgi:hypothetical protein
LRQPSILTVCCRNFGGFVARIHLHIFDKIFLKRGSPDNFHRQDKS